VFLHNYQSLPVFESGIVQDARILGDGYDFQIEKNSTYLLAEVKGVKHSAGSIRLTKNEYEKSIEYTSNYYIVVVSNLIESPKITAIANPANSLKLTKRTIISDQIHYHSESVKW